MNPLRAHVRSRLISESSIEVTCRDAGVAAALADVFPRGRRVHVTYLPNAQWAEIVKTSRALALAGFDPVPHVAARMISDLAALDGFLAAAAEEAGVRALLLIGGDIAAPRGAFGASIDVLRTGLLQKHGINTVAFAGHPEGHPTIPTDVMEAALAEKLAFARTGGLNPEIITQFCFEARPIVEWIQRLRHSGEAATVRVGMAAPTSAPMLMKFAIKCGIGNSLGALRKRALRIGSLIAEVSPAPLIDEIADAAVGVDLGAIAGIHCFVFGDVRKTVEWLERGGFD